MTPEPMHDEMRAALAAEALGALDGEERTLLLAHLAACQACRAELADLRASAGALALAAHPAPLDAARAGRVRARLLARAAADRAPSPADESTADRTLVAPVPPVVPAFHPPATTPGAADDDVTRVIPIRPAAARRTSALPWLAAAASLVLLLATGVYALNLRGDVASLAVESSVAQDRSQQLEQVLRDREATLAAVSAPAVRVIDMAAAGQAEPGGRMFWNPRTDRWTFFAHNLPAVESGREYQLWLITPGSRKISAGTFRPGARGEARVEATYALPADSLQAVAVTEEPAGGLEQPSGSIVIVGAVSSR